MRAVVQRATSASVAVDNETVSSIETGLLVLLGVGEDDTPQDIDYLARKVAGLRVFPDEAGNMNRSLLDAGGQALVISQFTLYGDVRRGMRPSFTKAMLPEQAERLYEQFVVALQGQGVPCQRGVFGAMMDVSLVNSGPVTILLDSSKAF